MAFIVFPGQYGVSTNKTRYSADGITWSYGTIPEVTNGAYNWQGIGKIAGKYFAGRRGNTVGGSSTDGITFSSYTLPIAVSNIGVNHNGALYYSSGSSVAYSSNGTSWTTVTLPNASGGTIGSNGTRLVSISSTNTTTSYSDNNGATWTAGGAMPAATSPYGSHITWNGSVFVATTTAGVAKSSDGITWTGDTTSGQYTWGVASNPSTGTIVVMYGLSSNTCKYSTNNGSTWTNATLPASMLWRDVTWDPNLQLFATFSYNSANTATSPDGITWTARTGISDFNQNYGMMSDPIAGVTYTLTAAATSTTTGTKSHTVGSTYPLTASAAPTSTASATFSVLDSPKPFIIFPDQYGGGAAGAKYSTDGINWNSTTMPVSGTNWVAARGKLGGYIIAVPQVAGIGNWARSIDGGATWQAMTGFGLNNASSAGANSNSAVVFTAGSSYARSTDGSTWTTGSLPNASGGSGTAGGVAFGGPTTPGVFVTVAGSKFAYSSDGINWTGGTLPNACGGYITWNGSVFCAISGNFTSTSPDGINWTARTRPTTLGSPWNIASKVVNGTGGTMVIIYQSSTCHYSTDNGVTWNTATLPGGLNTWVMVSYNDALNLFCASPYSSSTTVAATSPDGITWTQRTTNAITAEAQNMYGYQNPIALTPILGGTYYQTMSASATTLATSLLPALRNLSKLATVTSLPSKQSYIGYSKSANPTTTASKVSLVNKIVSSLSIPTALIGVVTTAVLRYITASAESLSNSSLVKSTQKAMAVVALATNASVANAVNKISSALSTSTAFSSTITLAILRYITASAESLSNSSLVKSTQKVLDYVASPVNVTINKITSLSKSLIAPTVSNTSKAALLNKSVEVANSSTMTKIGYYTLNAIGNTVSGIAKFVFGEKAANVTSTAFSSLGRQLQIALTAVVTSFASLTSVLNDILPKLSALFLTIAKSFTRKKVDSRVETTIQLQGIEHTTIRIN